MRKATLTARSPLAGEWTTVIEHGDITLFLAEVAGAVQGVTRAGSVVVALEIEEVSA